MAISLLRIGIRSTVLNLEKNASITSTSPSFGVINGKNNKRFFDTKEEPVCNGKSCSIRLHQLAKKEALIRERKIIVSALMNEQISAVIKRYYSKHHGRPEEERRRQQSDSDSDSDSDTECRGNERSEFWRRKMRTLHNLLDVDKDGLISYDDFVLFARRFQDLGHLDERQAEELSEILKITWEEQWGQIAYNFVSVEQYLEDMHHVLNDKALKRKAHRFLPYLFKAVDKDKSGFISVNEFKLFFVCLGLTEEQAAVSFAVIDTNGDGKLSIKEFVSLGKEFFFTQDEKRVSRMFWGPLVEH